MNRLLSRRLLRRACAGVIAFLAALALASCIGGATPTTSVGIPTTRSSPGTTLSPTPTTIPAASTTTSSAPTSTTPNPTLSARQLAGQRVIYSFKGPTPPARLLTLIRRGEAAGVIFFADNISSRAQVRALVRTLERAAADPRNPVRAPLLLMTDQEGGKIRRLPGAPALSEKRIGESGDPVREAAKAGREAGLNLSDVGLNVNLAPVLDVYRTAGDFADQLGRSYGRNPDVVSNLGAAFIRAQQQVGVAATAKHFPGLGAAGSAQNTDLQPVTLNVTLRTLATVDEVPYGAAVAAGVRLIMVSWAKYPALDPDRPAGLSPAIVHDRLRGRVGFKGVTITDALEAAALKAFGTSQRRAVLAAEAGMDLILCASRDVAQGERARDGLQTGYTSGPLDRAAFEASVQRVIDLRRSLSR